MKIMSAYNTRYQKNTITHTLIYCCSAFCMHKKSITHPAI